MFTALSYFVTVDETTPASECKVSSSSNEQKKLYSEHSKQVWENRSSEKAIVHLSFIGIELEESFW